MNVSINGHKQLTFEDLKGLRTEGYVRDSTRDQAQGYGPELQRRAIEGFAQSFGLVLGQAWFTDFISGTSTLKRSGFQQALLNAQNDRFDVLLVYHTSRFARNRADAIRYKQELRKLGKVVVFVSQGIISGKDNDFLNEGINEVLDEHYSRNLSRWVTDGLRVKHENGIANGVPPLGYKSGMLDSGKRESKVMDPETMPALLELLRSYATRSFSYQSLADHLNSEGHRNRDGELLTKGSIEHILSNRFYTGKVVYHPGEADEEVRDGAHEVLKEVKDLWARCQRVKQERTRHRNGRPRALRRSYPFSKVAVCQACSRPYSGQPVHRKSGDVLRRLYHTRPFCHLEPHSVRVERLMAQFQEGVLPYVTLDGEWRKAVIAAMANGTTSVPQETEKVQLEKALDNLRKQHLWGDLTDDQYRAERLVLERRTESLAPPSQITYLPDLERSAQLLSDLPAMWQHPGVADGQRESLVAEMFERVEVRGKELVAVEPKSLYQPLFAYAVSQGVRKCRGEWI